MRAITFGYWRFSRARCGASASPTTARGERGAALRGARSPVRAGAVVRCHGVAARWATLVRPPRGRTSSRNRAEAENQFSRGRFGLEFSVNKQKSRRVEEKPAASGEHKNRPSITLLAPLAGLAPRDRPVPRPMSTRPPPCLRPVFQKQCRAEFKSLSPAANQLLSVARASNQARASPPFSFYVARPLHLRRHRGHPVAQE